MALTIGQNLKQWRERRGLTQQQLAVKARLSVSNLAQMEQGQKEEPRASTVLALAEALGVSVYDLIADVTQAAACCYRLTPTGSPEQVTGDEIPDRPPDAEREADPHVMVSWMQAPILAQPSFARGVPAVLVRVADGKIELWEEIGEEPAPKKKLPKPPRPRK